MATRLIGTDTTDPRLPADVITATIGTTAGDLAAGNVAANKADKATTITPTAPLAGGGDLSANRTLTVSTFGTSASGVVPASGGGTTNYLRADGTWSAPAGGGGGGITAEDAVDAVAAALVEGVGIDLVYDDGANTITVTADKTEMSLTKVDVGLGNVDNTADASKPVFSTSSTTPGIVPGSNSVGTGSFLRADGTWALPPGAGGTVGHATYTHNSTLTEPPATGQIRFNNASQPAATKVWVSQNDEDGMDVSIGLAKILAGHQMYIQDYDNAANWIKYNVTAVSDDGAYYDFTVTYHSGPGGIPSGSGAAGRVEFQPIAPGTVGVPPGGTSGQQLTKSSGTDYAVGWADPGVATSTTISTTAPLAGGGDLSANRTLTVGAASETATGVVELATVAETTTGTDTTRAVTAAGVKAVADTKPASTTVDTIWTGNQAAYDAIGTKDSATLYFIT